MILVTGATGKLGRLVLEHLLRRGVAASQLVAAVRSPERAQDLAARGVSVRALDYTQPATADAALAGIDRVLLVSSSTGIGARAEQHQTVIDAARRAGVRLLAYTSILRGGASPIGLARDHAATEAAIAASGVPSVLLRNGWYVENYTENLGGALASGVMLGAARDGRVSPATRADLAEAAAVVLSTDGHVGRVYELAGDVGYTLAEIAAAASKASGKPIRYQDLAPEVYASTLEGFGVPGPFAAALADADAGLASGALFDEGRALSRLIGHPTQTLETALATQFAA